MTVLKPVVEKFHGNAENYYSNFYGLLQENLLPNVSGGDITQTNVLLSEVSNHVLMRLSTKKIHRDDQTTKHDSFKLSDNELKGLQYIICYVVHKLHSKFVFILNSVYQYFCAAKLILMISEINKC